MSKYPKIKVKLTGTDGNAFALLGKVQNAMKKAKVDPIQINLFISDAMSGDYDHLLCVCCEWVNVS